MIASRLLELGHSPDFITPAAEADIIGRAAGSKRALQTILSATLFVASTEDAPCIEPAHVGQATLGDPPPPARHGGRWAAAAGCAIFLLLVVIFSISTHYPAERPAPAAPARQTQAQAVPAKPPPVPAPAPPRAPISPLERVVAQLPDAPTPVLHLFAAQPNAAGSASLASHLRDAGLAPMMFQAGSDAGPGNVHVRYYFIEDRALAQHVASLAGSTPPELALRPSVGAPPPGSIDVIVGGFVPLAPAPDRVEKKLAAKSVACLRPSRTSGCKQPVLHVAQRNHIRAEHPVVRHGFLDSVGRFFHSIFQTRRK